MPLIEENTNRFTSLTLQHQHNPMLLPDCMVYCTMDEFNDTYIRGCGCSLNIEIASNGYQSYNVSMIVILLPMVAVYGVIGNFLNVVVYTRSSMRCSLNYYLAFLAVSDLLVTLSAVFMFTFESLRSSNMTVKSIYLMGIPYVFPLAMIAQTCSVYYTVAAGVDCFISVVTPRCEKIYCTTKRSIIVGVQIFVLAILYNMPRWFEVEVIQCFDYQKNTTNVDVCPSALRQSELYNEVYYLNMYTIIMSIGPLVVLLVLNILVVRATVLRKKQWTNATTRAATAVATASVVDSGSADIVSLICVVCLFIFCNSLSLAINFIETFADVGNAMGYLIDLSNFLVVVNSSVNFFIYLFFGEHFRNTMKKLITPRRKIRKRKLRQCDNRLITHLNINGVSGVEGVDC